MGGLGCWVGCAWLCAWGFGAGLAGVLVRVAGGAAGAAVGEVLELLVFGHFDDAGPFFFGGDAEHVDDLGHLVALEGYAFLAVHLGFFALEDGAQGEEFGEDAAHGPQVDGGGVVFAAQE